VTGRRGRRRKQLLDDVKETRGYYKLQGEVLDRNVWGTGFGRGCGLVIGRSVKRVNYVETVVTLQIIILEINIFNIL
jgi:hypothetical protein